MHRALSDSGAADSREATNAGSADDREILIHGWAERQNREARQANQATLRQIGHVLAMFDQLGVEVVDKVLDCAGRIPVWYLERLARSGGQVEWSVCIHPGVTLAARLRALRDAWAAIAFLDPTQGEAAKGGDWVSCLGQGIRPDDLVPEDLGVSVPDSLPGYWTLAGWCPDGGEA